MHWVAYLAVYFAGIFALLLNCPILQRYVIYKAGIHADHTYPPSAFGLPTPDIRYNKTAYVFKARIQPPRATLFYFHGTRMSVVHGYWQIGRTYKALEGRVDIIALSYLSSWYKGQQSMLDVSERVVLANRKYPYIIMGSSLGSVVAIHMATRRRSDHLLMGLIAENPLTSISDLLPRPLHSIVYLSSDNWATTLTNVTCPVLVITSERDEIVPPKMSTILLKGAANSKHTQVILRGANHGDATSHPDYLPAIVKFVDNKK